MPRASPEARIRAAIIRKLESEGWFVKIVHGGVYQSGLPDLYATHPIFGQRWIECKNPKAYKFTPAQLKTFPILVSHGAGVWVLVSCNDSEYRKLFMPCNWESYK